MNSNEGVIQVGRPAVGRRVRVYPEPLARNRSRYVPQVPDCPGPGPRLQAAKYLFMGPVAKAIAWPTPPGEFAARAHVAAAGRRRSKKDIRALLSPVTHHLCTVYACAV